MAHHCSIRENGVDLAGHGLGHALQELPGGAPVCSFNESGDGELGCPVCAREEVKPIVGKTVPPDCFLTLLIPR